MNEVYYRPIITEDGELAVVTMQWFDEYDYNKNSFLTDQKFETKLEGMRWIHDIFLLGKTSQSLERFRQLVWN